ncbi:MAG: hypothetical protein Q9164_007963, partial [Protoblastenia rupestris]
PPPVENVDTTSPLFEIEVLLDKRTVRGRPKYLVKWKGYRHKENVYYGLDDLKGAIDLVKEYNAKDAAGGIATTGRRRKK